GAGIELLQQVRREDPDAAVIVVGGMEVKNHIVSLELGAYAHLWKPVNMDELLIVVERALERRQLLIERREYHELLEEIRRKSAERSVLPADLAPTVSQYDFGVHDHCLAARHIRDKMFATPRHSRLLPPLGRDGVAA